MKKLKELEKRAKEKVREVDVKDPFDIISEKIDLKLSRSKSNEEETEYLDELYKLHELELTSTGRQAQQLQSLIQTMSQGKFNWDKKSIDRFVQKYIQIVSSESEVRLSTYQLEKLATSIEGINLDKSSFYDALEEFKQASGSL